VVAASPEAAREAARPVGVDYAAEPHDVELREDHPGRYKPATVFPNQATDTEQGDFDAAFARADVRVDSTYRTSATHNNPMEPHATVAVWGADGVTTLHESMQAPTLVSEAVARAFGLPPERVLVIAEHVGGGFGSKLRARPHAILAVMAAQVVGRPVKLSITCQQMFAVGGYRTPTIQRVRLGAGRDGRLVAIAHEVVEQTSTLVEFAEQTAVATRMLYAAGSRRTAHRLARLDLRRRRGCARPASARGCTRCARPRDRAPLQQPQPGRLPARGRRAHGRLHGAVRAQWAGRAPRRLRRPRSGRLPDGHQRRRRLPGGGHGRRGGCRGQPGRGQGPRRGRHRRHRRRHRQPTTPPACVRSVPIHLEGFLHSLA
jgi:hypothetical protein